MFAESKAKNNPTWIQPFLAAVAKRIRPKPAKTGGFSCLAECLGAQSCVQMRTRWRFA
jgi:hypothetical protein